MGRGNRGKGVAVAQNDSELRSLKQIRAESKRLSAIEYDQASFFDPDNSRDPDRSLEGFNNSGTATLYDQKFSLQRHANNPFNDREFLELNCQLEHLRDFVDTSEIGSDYEVSNLFSMLKSGYNERALLAKAIIEERRRIFYKIEAGANEQGVDNFDKEKVAATLRTPVYSDLEGNRDKWLYKNWDADSLDNNYQRETIYQILRRREAIEKLDPRGSYKEILDATDYFLGQVSRNKFNWVVRRDTRPDRYAKTLAIVEAALLDPECRKIQEDLDKLLPEFKKIASTRGRSPITPTITYPENSHSWSNFQTYGRIVDGENSSFGEIFPDTPDGIIFIKKEWAEKAIDGSSYTTPVHELIHATQDYLRTDQYIGSFAHPKTTFFNEGLTQSLTEEKLKAVGRTVPEKEYVYVREVALMSVLTRSIQHRLPEKTRMDILEDLNAEQNYDDQIAYITNRIDFKHLENSLSYKFSGLDKFSETPDNKKMDLFEEFLELSRIGATKKEKAELENALEAADKMLEELDSKQA